MDLLKNKKYLVIQNDLDSYLSAALLQKYYNFEVIGYYDFDMFLLRKKVNKNEILGVDVDIVDITCISNHVLKFDKNTYRHHQDSISCNSHITVDNYYEKSMFSTTLYLYSLLKLPLPKNKIGKGILLCIDSTYLGYYKQNGRYKKYLQRYLEEYDMIELIDFLNKHTCSDFEKAQKVLNTRRKIYTEELFDDAYVILEENFVDERLKRILDYLELKKVILPSFFNLEKRLKTGEVDVNRFKREYLNRDDLFSYSITRKNKVKYSLFE